MSRMLAAKASLATRVDALGEESGNELGIEHRAKLEARLKFLEEGGLRAISGSGKRRAKIEKYDNKSQVHTYKAASDSTFAPQVKRKFDEPDEEEAQEEEVAEEKTPKDKKKKKKLKTEVEEEEMEEEVESPPKKVKKEKKSKSSEEPAEEAAEDEAEEETPKSKKKKKKRNQD
ncbi:unnamed protein product [Oppiella nova]|uniref:Nop domain-containing protein n=1 Tax=Oppiella nova TaxID=334625 RepID=A0A7R9LH88_9ACAR|nr:unnamed protein product [Oppiella nova]CAG2163657.1 unnamed protein product [Oppiella nova]